MTLNDNSQHALGNFDLVKQLNYSIVYRLIDQYGPISRIQLAQKSQLAPASITKIIRLFLESGLITEIEQQVSTGGRRAVSLVVNHDAFQVIGVRLGRSTITLGLYDLGAKCLNEESFELKYTDQISLEGILFEKLHLFIKRFKRLIHNNLAIAVTLPGLITNVVHYLPHLSVSEWHLAERVSEVFKCPAFIGHNIRSQALAEHYFGGAKESQDSILVSVHHGVGAGIILDGNILLGKKGNLGEIGHLQIDPLGELCHCGNFGCLETVVSNDKIRLQVMNLLSKGFESSLTIDDCGIDSICKAANQGDRLAISVLQRSSELLGKAIAIIVNLFNPEKILIAGEIVAAEKIVIESIARVIKRECLSIFAEQIQLEVAKLPYPSAIGALALAKQRLFSGELLVDILDK